MPIFQVFLIKRTSDDKKIAFLADKSALASLMLAIMFEARGRTGDASLEMNVESATL